MTKLICSDPVLKSVLEFQNSLPTKLANKYKPKKNTFTEVKIPAGFKVMIGFEFEFLTSKSQSAIVNYIKTHIFRKTKSGYGDWPTDIINYLRVHGDGSIRYSNVDHKLYNDLNNKRLPSNRRGHEISTPALEWSKSWKLAIKLVKYLNSIGSITNNSCGLHMNISVWKKRNGKYVNVTRNYQSTDFYDFLAKSETKLKRLWNREHSYWCRSQLISIRNLKNRYTTVGRISDLGYTYNVIGKYKTFNISRLASERNPYIECRIAGGANSHIRLTDAYHTISSFANSIVSSLK